MLREFLLVGTVCTVVACGLNHPAYVRFGLADSALDNRVDVTDDTSDLGLEVVDEDAAIDVTADNPAMEDGPGPEADIRDEDPVEEDVACATGRMHCAGGCVDTATDTANCGACGHVCGASQTCTAGVCACATGAADCDGNSANGCEVDVVTSAANCGACRNICAARPNSMPACIGGTCVPQCAANFGDCDGMEANGCEVDLRTSTSHCGACGNGCVLRANAILTSCVEGRCTIPRIPQGCVSGYGDCNLIEADGCETNGFASPTNCGGCDVRCMPGRACVAGVCGACSTGRMMCGSTCVDLESDLANCGACGNTCPTGGNCLRGICGCPFGNTICGTACIDTRSDVRNCGACGTVCATGASCNSGHCNCPMTQMSCSERCVNTSTDNANCGGCGNACLTCLLGGCVCGGAGSLCCVSGSACAAGLRCMGGRCR